MSLMERLFLKKRPDRSANDEPISPIQIVSGTPVRFLSQAAVATADVAQRKNPQLYRITNFVASSVQAVPWFCEADPDLKDSERAGATPIKDINSLLRSPNDNFTSQQLEYWFSLNLMLYGRAHFKVGVKSDGTPNAIYPLAAKFTKGILNSRGTVEEYEYGEGNNAVKIPTRRTAEKRAESSRRPMEAYAAEISFPSLSPCTLSACS